MKYNFRKCFLLPAAAFLSGKQTLALILANFFTLPAVAIRLKVGNNSVTQRVVLIFENAAFGRFCNNATKIKTEISLSFS